MPRKYSTVMGCDLCDCSGDTSVDSDQPNVTVTCMGYTYSLSDTVCDDPGCLCDNLSLPQLMAHLGGDYHTDDGRVMCINPPKPTCNGIHCDCGTYPAVGDDLWSHDCCPCGFWTDVGDHSRHDCDDYCDDDSLTSSINLLTCHKCESSLNGCSDTYMFRYVSAVSVAAPAIAAPAIAAPVVHSTSHVDTTQADSDSDGSSTDSDSDGSSVDSDQPNVTVTCMGDTYNLSDTVCDDPDCMCDNLSLPQLMAHLGGDYHTDDGRVMCINPPKPTCNGIHCNCGAYPSVGDDKWSHYCCDCGFWTGDLVDDNAGNHDCDDCSVRHIDYCDDCTARHSSVYGTSSSYGHRRYSNWVDCRKCATSLDFSHDAYQFRYVPAASVSVPASSVAVPVAASVAVPAASVTAPASVAVPVASVAVPVVASVAVPAASVTAPASVAVRAVSWCAVFTDRIDRKVPNAADFTIDSTGCIVESTRSTASAIVSYPSACGGAGAEHAQAVRDQHLRRHL